jgi:3' terminal RNA ribose 2'-O-methyltransferase Hen1
LGFLLAKHPDKIQTYEVPGGQAHVFYPESHVARCTAALLLDLDPVTLTRQEGDRVNEFALQPYVNDRPYVASSWLTTALTKVFGSALNGKCREFPDLPKEAWPFEVTLSAVPGSDESIQRLFGPLGYEIAAQRGSLDEQFPEWGQSRYVALTLRNTCRLADLLSHLYVLIPVLDADKHYYLSEDEAEKLLSKGGNWLDQHPEKGFIVRRYLQRSNLVKNFNTRAEAATESLQEPAVTPEPVPVADDFASALAEPKRSEREFRLHDVRLRTA